MLSYVTARVNWDQQTPAGSQIPDVQAIGYFTALHTAAPGLLTELSGFLCANFACRMRNIEFTHAHVRQIICVACESK